MAVVTAVEVERGDYLVTSAGALLYVLGADDKGWLLEDSATLKVVVVKADTLGARLADRRWQRLDRG